MGSIVALSKTCFGQLDQALHCSLLLRLVLLDSLLPLLCASPQHFLPPDLPLILLPLHLALLLFEPFDAAIVVTEELGLGHFGHSTGIGFGRGKRPVDGRFFLLLLEQAVFRPSFSPRRELF